MVLGRDYIPVQISDHTFLFYLTSLPSEHQNCFCILLIWFVIQNSKFVSSSRKSNFFLSKNLYFYFFVQNFFPCCLDTSGSMIALWVPEISPWAVFVTDVQGELGICICICVCIFNCNCNCICIWFVFQMRSRNLSLVLAAPHILALLLILPPGDSQHHPKDQGGTESKFTPSLSKSVTLLHWMHC